MEKELEAKAQELRALNQQYDTAVKNGASRRAQEINQQRKQLIEQLSAEKENVIRSKQEAMNKRSAEGVIA